MELTVTDQTACYDADGRIIDCKGSGHDGDGRKPDDVAERNRFKVLDDSVKDQWTGCVWHIHAGLSDFPLTWQEAVAFTDEVNQSGGAASCSICIC